jgi:hypothetical protein
LNIKTEVIPVSIRANRNISKPSRNYLNITHGNHEIKEAQKTAILALQT